MSSKNLALSGLFDSLSADLASHQTEPASKRLYERMRKRARLPAKEDLDKKAKLAFLKTNAEMALFSPDASKPHFECARRFVYSVLEGFTRRLDPDYIQGTLVWSFLLENWRFGPGASIGNKFTHAVDKFEGDFTTTVAAEPLVSILRKSNAYFSRQDAMSGRRPSVVRGSKLSTVPKNEENNRTIAIEPLGNMCLQLAAGRYLEEALRRIGLSISEQQPLNKALARVGSVEGHIATIDLSSASDRIHPEVVRLLFPPEWYRLLMSLRSPMTEVDGVFVDLHMISTMGNGFTFPLMTLVILSLVYANRVALGGSDRCFIDWSCTAVYGDDIIVPVTEYDSLCVMLEESGLLVNRDKSFATGTFRESCGGDFDRGVDITPFYVKELATESDVYVALNSVLDWSCRHRPLWNSMRYLRSLLKQRVLLVPEYENPDSGIRLRECPRRYLKLVPKAKQFEVRLSDDFGLVPLMAGGYISSSSGQHVFTPRSKRTRYVLRPSRLTKGYLDGRCELSFTARESRDRSLFWSLIA